MELPIGKLAEKRRSFTNAGGGIFARMFGGNNNNGSSSPSAADESISITAVKPNNSSTSGSSSDKKRRGSTSKTSAFITSAKNSITNLGNSNNDQKEPKTTPPKDDALATPPGPQNNSAGESKPGPRSTFRVGVTEDKNKKCRRTMEDTHSFLYNFLQPLPPATLPSTTTEETAESDNGYFAIFDGHAGTYAADWCGKKLHLILEEIIRKNPNTPIPELLDMTFTNCDGQLEKLPVRNSGCTAVCAVLRWEDRTLPTNTVSPEGAKGNGGPANNENSKPTLNLTAEKSRVLYTANVGDARIVLCRNGKALRLSYDHKGSDENEGKRVANAGGLILNNRVNGQLSLTCHPRFLSGEGRGGRSCFGLLTLIFYRCFGRYSCFGRQLHERTSYGTPVYDRDRSSG